MATKTTKPEPVESKTENDGTHLLFAGTLPNGGFNDLRFRGSLEDCQTYFDSHLSEFHPPMVFGHDTWGHIVEVKTLTIVDRTNNSTQPHLSQPWSVE